MLVLVTWDGNNVDELYQKWDKLQKWFHRIKLLTLVRSWCKARNFQRTSQNWTFTVKWISGNNHTPSCENPNQPSRKTALNSTKQINLCVKPPSEKQERVACRFQTTNSWGLERRSLVLDLGVIERAAKCFEFWISPLAILVKMEWIWCDSCQTTIKKMMLV